VIRIVLRLAALMLCLVAAGCALVVVFLSPKKERQS